MKKCVFWVTNIDISFHLFSPNVIFLSPWHVIRKRFEDMNAKILFSTDKNCWPDESLCDFYPPLEGNDQKYLNSGMLIGFAKNLFHILDSQDFQEAEDDQLFFTNAYLNRQLRGKQEENEIKLDHESRLFQNLDSSLGKKLHKKTFDEYCKRSIKISR